MVMNVHLSERPAPALWGMPKQSPNHALGGVPAAENRLIIYGSSDM